VSIEVERVIELLTRAPSTTVLCSDFDGTLAPLVEDPTTSRALPGALSALIRLSNAFATVAVISGRPVTFLVEHLDSDDVHRLDLFGRYGAEHRGRDGSLHEAEVSSNVRLHLIEIGAEAATRVPGILVEDKGGSLSLHWRSHPEAKEVILDIARRHAARGDIEAREGKMIIEFVGKGSPAKGAAVASLWNSDITTSCFLGDDLSDLDAFDALDEFESRGGTALRIAVSSSEMPSALRTRSDLVLDGPDAAVTFLIEVADRLS
jgi:trehalose 6-phosphate phosphatase